jgi:GH15 family glucan-1,4-alpha-glucosidase
MASRIEDYAIIGDCETAALVSRDGSLDWLCWPNFASPACFAALLGNADNGRWFLGPLGHTRSTRAYREHTLILETTFESEDGAVILTDFMPIGGQHSTVVRTLRGVRGQVRMGMELVVRCDYGRSVPWVSRMDGALRAIAGPDMLVLRTPVPLRGRDLRTISEFVVREGEEIPFVLSYGRSYDPPPSAIDYKQSFHDTEAFWTKWASQQSFSGDYAGAIERSLIVLKALTYRHSGGIVAAPTTSLPECIGSQRNWDYRYCWLRDATFTLLALMHAGYYEEAEAWRDWLLRAVAGSPDQVQIMYGIAGERRLTELELPWLAGYEHSQPVRIGNAASNQLQLDVYGEVADALFQAELGGIKFRKIDLRLLRTLTDHLLTIWDQPDEGIWETRGGPQQFTYSKMMAWVAFDRAINRRVAQSARTDPPRNLREVV